MAKFTLTKKYVEDIFTAGPAGFSIIDPDVKWIIASETKDPGRLTGIYNLSSWLQEVRAPVVSRLKDGKLEITPTSIDVVGNKAIVEIAGTATQLNGKPYNNRYVWFLIFSEEGKVIEIREYLDSALVQDVMQTNP
ncbi:Ketosteroid isomerase [Mycena venus]|uniref:Ketosteroid isomerase n=1 Tax=Mycena venus TaxID=2733690 RepID=A0A8H6Z094_9AGAR|nr:Ketosteroid isomerase [Mycena venus]